MAGLRDLLSMRSPASVIWFALALLLPIEVWAVVSVTGPDPAPRPLVASSPSPTPSPEPSRSRAVRTTPPPSPRPTRSASRAASPDVSMFRGLGAWVDVYDFDSLDAIGAVAVMRAQGVRTLYIQTGRYNTPHDVAPEVDPWLEAAHAAGMEVVGWYLPSYKRMSRDVRRMVAVTTYRTASGHSFDAAGIDIESHAEVAAGARWNARVAEHARRVREQIGSSYPLAAITPTPLGMGRAPRRWFGFPWRTLARETDVIMLMSYWSFRDDCPRDPSHCAYGYTYENVRRTRALAGDVPVHVIGGVGDSIDAGEVDDFARAARKIRAFGASLYDFDTTKAEFWDALSRLRDL